MDRRLPALAKLHPRQDGPNHPPGGAPGPLQGVNHGWIKCGVCVDDCVDAFVMKTDNVKSWNLVPYPDRILWLGAISI